MRKAVLGAILGTTFGAAFGVLVIMVLRGGDLEDYGPYIVAFIGVFIGTMGGAAAAIVSAVNHQGERILRQLSSPAGLENYAAVPGLIKALKDEDSDVRVSAAHALGYLGGAARAAVPALGRAQEDANLEVRLAAIQALERLKASAEASTEARKIAQAMEVVPPAAVPPAAAPSRALPEGAGLYQE
jgi:hypothetical protein